MKRAEGCLRDFEIVTGIFLLLISILKIVRRIVWTIFDVYYGYFEIFSFCFNIVLLLTLIYFGAVFISGRWRKKAIMVIACCLCMILSVLFLLCAFRSLPIHFFVAIGDFFMTLLLSLILLNAIKIRSRVPMLVISYMCIAFKVCCFMVMNIGNYIVWTDANYHLLVVTILIAMMIIKADTSEYPVKKYRVGFVGSIVCFFFMAYNMIIGLCITIMNYTQHDEHFVYIIKQLHSLCSVIPLISVFFIPFLAFAKKSKKELEGVLLQPAAENVDFSE